MADEIQIEALLVGEKNNVKVVQRVGQNDLLVDQSTAGKIENVQDIGTTAENIDLGGLSSPGWGFYRNLDGTNFVEIGADQGGTFVPVVLLQPNEIAVFRLAAGTPQARFDTAAGRLLYCILET